MGGGPRKELVGGVWQKAVPAVLELGRGLRELAGAARHLLVRQGHLAMKETWA